MSHFICINYIQFTSLLLIKKFYMYYISNIKINTINFISRVMLFAKLRVKTFLAYN